MDKENKFALLVIGIPILGLLYVASIIAFMSFSSWAREHPIITATVFVLTPSLVSGSIWLFSSFRARKKQNLGL